MTKPDKKTSNTCIVIVKNRRGQLMIAGDRRCTWGFSYAQSMDTPKINIKDGVLLGATGSGDLCGLFVDTGGFKIPERHVKCINTYMYHTFKPAAYKFLINQSNRTESAHPLLALAPGAYVEVIIGIDKTVWSMVICNPLDEMSEHMAGDISISPVSIPYAAGCGRLPAISVIEYELMKTGYITKEILENAVKIAAKVSPGCDDIVDILISD